MKILLIEDDLQICKVISKYFNNNGAEITEVHNGTDALETVEKGVDDYSLMSFYIKWRLSRFSPKRQMNS